VRITYVLENAVACTSQDSGKRQPIKEYLLSCERIEMDKSKQQNSKGANGTHFLSSAEGGTSQGSEIKRERERHSQTGERRVKHKSRQRKKASQDALTLWRT
jgi:hypothetical protein